MSPPDWLLPLGFAAYAILGAAALWKVPQWQVGNVNDLTPKERFDRVNEARKTLATILGGVAILAGGYFTWQNFKVAQEALTVSQQGQITDRFTKAIEQLGAVDNKGEHNVEVRVGGIYALERIATDSKRDRWPIIQVLCTYVRANTRRDQTSVSSKVRTARKMMEESQASASPPELRSDIQAALTVLGRLHRESETKEEQLDLHQTELRAADLTWGWFTSAFLTGTDLREAYLSGSDFSGAYLFQVDFGRADLMWVGFAHADLRRASFVSADMTLAELDGANLSGANLRGANLTGADLSGADLRDTQGLTQEQVNVAKGNSTTQLPKNLHMPESWKK